MKMPNKTKIRIVYFMYVVVLSKQITSLYMVSHFAKNYNSFFYQVSGKIGDARYKTVR